MLVLPKLISIAMILKSTTARAWDEVPILQSLPDRASVYQNAKVWSYGGNSQQFFSLR
jgi:hypothetical protein